MEDHMIFDRYFWRALMRWWLFFALIASACLAMILVMLFFGPFIGLPALLLLISILAAMEQARWDRKENGK